MEDLKEGMELQGTVRNVVDFGAFVDIGVKQDGLVHISKAQPFLRQASARRCVGRGHRHRMGGRCRRCKRKGLLIDGKRSIGLEVSPPEALFSGGLIFYIAIFNRMRWTTPAICAGV